MLLDRIYYLCVDIKYYVPVLRVFLCGTMLGARDTKEKDDDILLRVLDMNGNTLISQLLMN